MSNVKLLILGCCSLLHFSICTCLSVVVCFILKSLTSMSCKTFWKLFFPSIWIPTFRKLCYGHCNNFINTIFQKGICQISYIIPWAITSPVTTKYTWMWLRNFWNHFFFLIEPSFIINNLFGDYDNLYPKWMVYKLTQNIL